MNADTFISFIKTEVSGAPHAREALLPGASAGAIRRCESETGLLFPVELKSFLMLSDGLSPSFVLRRGLVLLSTQQILDFWKMHIDVLQWVPDVDGNDDDLLEHRDPEIKAVVANRKWLPVAEDMDGNYSVYIDFDPTRKGVSGQVVFVYPEATEWRLIARDIEGLWDWFVDGANNRTS